MPLLPLPKLLLSASAPTMQIITTTTTTPLLLLLLLLLGDLWLVVEPRWVLFQKKGKVLTIAQQLQVLVLLLLLLLLLKAMMVEGRAEIH
jgi:hypothetical protein